MVARNGKAFANSVWGSVFALHDTLGTLGI